MQITTPLTWLPHGDHPKGRTTAARLLHRFTILSLLIPALSGAGEGTEYWGVSLTWSPQFCHDQPGDIREFQCAEQHGFVLGGFEPLGGSGVGEVCPNRHVDIPSDVTERMLEVMWNKAAMKRQWNLYGRCSGLEMMEYFVEADYLAERIIVPEEFGRPFARLSTTADNVRLLFRQSNSDLDPESIMLRCDGEWLRDVVVCAGKDLKYRRCDGRPRETCPASVWVRGVNSRLKLKTDD